MEPARNVENEPFFEPLGRCRAFTWHGDLNAYSGMRDSTSETGSPGVVIKSEVLDSGGGHKDDVLNLKKPSTRRNAWGCMSYADLITKAIESVPDKRLTLSQIYGWMIQNVPYFKDKGESNSSAGWKNSIRHNLSLHRKFTRVQNEGTGKSSWWMVNSDAKTCKSPRRRASSMDNKMYEKKKHRQAALMYRIEEQNAAGGEYASSNTVPSVGEVHKLDSFATAFSPVDLRMNGRTTGLTSTHLTPIDPVAESTFDSEVMTQPSPLYWNQCHSVNPPYGHAEGLTETVGESLAELFTPDMSAGYERPFSPDHRLTLLQNVNEKYISEPGYGPFPDIGGALPSPPPYAGRIAEQPRMPADGIFPQAGAEMCPNEFLQQSPVSSPRRSDVFLAAPYGTRPVFNQVQRDDVAAMQYYSAERPTDGFAPRGDDNSVLRRMLMQTQQKSTLRFGDRTSADSIVKSEPGTCDSFAYPDARSTLLCPGDASSSLAYVDSTAGNVDRDAGGMGDFDSESGDRMIKKESCSNDAWEFDMTSIANGGMENGSEN